MFSLLSCKPTIPSTSIFLGQGLMAGEVTSHSVILQARLTSTETPIQGYLEGKPGKGFYEISTERGFSNPIKSELVKADSSNDYILKVLIGKLKPDTKYYFRLVFGHQQEVYKKSHIGSFRTLAGADRNSNYSMVVVTGMNYYHFHFGKYERSKAYKGQDKALGYPALEAIKKLKPDYFVGTGDNVYFDHPVESGFKKAEENGKQPHPGYFEGKEVIDEAGMRRKYHLQFSQPRYKDLFAQVATF